MISFYPGPSQLHPQIKEYLMEAADSGILSMNHRSAAFVDLSRRTVALLKEKLLIPSNYSIYFLSSATECWEVVAQAFPNWPSLHVYNGAFGQKWLEYRQKLGQEAHGHAFSCQRGLPIAHLQLPKPASLLCLTHTETSNGSFLSNHTLAKVRVHFPTSLIAIDATSAMGGARLDWLSGDLWFASVQKCFGLPAGMGLLVCGPRALEKAKAEGQKAHYNSLLSMHEQMERWQTTHTPNVLGIFLLSKVMESALSANMLHRQLLKRQQALWASLEKMGMNSLIASRRLRSPTVLAIKGAPSWVQEMKETALREGLLLGNGYGDWKDGTFRIANFPALQEAHYQALLEVLRCEMGNE